MANSFLGFPFFFRLSSSSVEILWKTLKIPNCYLQGLTFFPVCYIQTLAYRTCKMHTKQALHAHCKHVEVKGTQKPTRCPHCYDLSCLLSSVSTEQLCQGVLQAVAACLVNVPAHHGKGNATGLCCSLVCKWWGYPVEVYTCLFSSCFVTIQNHSAHVSMWRNLWALEKPLWRWCFSTSGSQSFPELIRKQKCLETFFFKASSFLLFSFALLNFELCFFLPFIFSRFINQYFYFSSFLGLFVPHSPSAVDSRSTGWWDTFLTKPVSCYLNRTLDTIIFQTFLDLQIPRRGLMWASI